MGCSCTIAWSRSCTCLETLRETTDVMNLFPKHWPRGPQMARNTSKAALITCALQARQMERL